MNCFGSWIRSKRHTKLEANGLIRTLIALREVGNAQPAAAYMDARGWIVLVCCVLLTVSAVIGYVSRVPTGSNKLVDLMAGKRVDHSEVWKADIGDLLRAIKDFEICYHAFPSAPSLKAEADNRMLMAILLARTNVPGVAVQNAKGIQFILLRDGAFRDGAFVDPWGHQYHIAIDYSQTGKVKVGQKMIPVSVAVWSDGPNRMNEYGEGDDKHSW